MKISKFFSGIFAVLGTVLMICTVVLCLISLNAEPKVLEAPAAARERAEAMMDAVCRGDFAAAGSYLYGQPDLGADREPAGAAGALVWDAYVSSLSCRFAREPEATDSGIAWTVYVDALDVSAVTASLEAQTRALLLKWADAAEDPADVYDEKNNFREDLVDEALLEALEQALGAETETVTREVTLNLICRDGQWWVVPDQALLQLLSGGGT